MNIKKTTDGKMFEVSFASHDELRLMETIMGNTYSGGNQWRVAPEDYEKSFGITYDRAHELFEMLRAENNKEEISTPISLEKLEKNDIFAMEKAIECILAKLSDEDFSTLLGVGKSAARVLLDQFNQGGLS